LLQKISTALVGLNDVLHDWETHPSHRYVDIRDFESLPVTPSRSNGLVNKVGMFDDWFNGSQTGRVLGIKDEDALLVVFICEDDLLHVT
jgi:hypothetical protein